ncbi:hypothetical protein ABVT39_007967 [Epinephelus coioides]
MVVEIKDDPHAVAAQQLKCLFGTGPAAIKVLVSEGSDVTLPCSLSTKENIQQKLFDWRKDDGMMGVFMYDKGLHYNNGGSGQDEQFKGRVFHFQDELKHGNASIIIRNTKMADSGDYTCFFPLFQTPQIFHIDLVVVSSPKPSVTVLKATDDGVQLQCEVHGAPSKPKVEWKDSDGNILPAEEPQVTDRGGSYDIILQTTVTKTDRYRCVVTQEEINHQIHAEIPVDITDDTWNNINVKWFLAAAMLAFFGPAAVYFFWWSRRLNKRIDRGPAAIKVLVSEGSDVTLPCSLSTKENIKQNLFDWTKDDGMMGVFMYDKGLHYNNGGSGQDEQFKGRVFHFQDELKHGNASIIIRNTKMADSGDYTCFFPLLQTPQMFHIDLVVVSSPKPSVTVLKVKLDWMQLQCEVRGASPKPKVEWKDSDGNILPAEEPQVTDRGGSYDIILQTSVTKTDRYHCVVTQEEINHQIHTEIPVHIIDENWSNSNVAGLVAGAILALLWGFFKRDSPRHQDI